jgi:hypothetical protein
MFRTHGMNTKPITPVRDQVPPQTSWKTDPVKAATDRAYDFVASLKPTKSPFSEGTEMKDIQLEGWENQLSNLLNEGITVSSSTGQQSSPDSVTVSATDADAEHLLSVLRNAGVGLFGDGEEHTSDYGAPMSSHEPEGHGQEPELAPTVVGDGDDMMALIKKMTGIEMDSGDYEDEEGSEELAGTLEPADADEEHDSEEDKEETDEGNAFTGKLAQTQQGDEFELDGEKYKDTSSIEEGEQECNECGMMESQCECDHEQVEENFSNDAGGDAMENTEMAKLKALLSMGNDLHKMKSSQAMGNPVKVAEDSSINDWKKLAGI